MTGNAVQYVESFLIVPAVQIIGCRAAANYLNSRHYQEALNVLNSITSHSAQWYYYSAIANSGLGNNVLALQQAQTAAQMEPSNQTYQELVQRLNSGSSFRDRADRTCSAASSRCRGSQAAP